MTENIDIQHEEVQATDIILETQNTESRNSESANSPDSDNSHEFANPQNEDSHLNNLSGINSTSENNDKGDSSHNDDDSPDTFPREYVEKLRDENAKYRQRAQRSDDLAQRLHEALVAATGRLQDPTDLAFNEDHLD